MTRIAFLGTPGAAVPTLRALADDHTIPLVITQPDRPRGRSKTPSPPPVKEEALRLGLDVRQPSNSEEIRLALESVEPLDVAVVVAYGRLLRADALSVPANGMLNVHFSLLPRWRGAAPVARAIMSGDPMTGVSIIRLDEGLDTGPVLTAQAVDILPDETAGELTTRLATLGADLLCATLPAFVDGRVVPLEQTDEGMTYAHRIDPADRPLGVRETREAAVYRVRALSPEPGATLRIDGVTCQILRARVHPARPEPGRWVDVGGVPVAGFANGGVELVEIQSPGRRPVSGDAWLRGRHRDSGMVE